MARLGFVWLARAWGEWIQDWEVFPGGFGDLEATNVLLRADNSYSTEPR